MTTQATATDDKRPPLTSRERLQIVVFAIGVVLAPVGLGMAVVPQQQCSVEQLAAAAESQCSTTGTRVAGGIAAGIGFGAVWFGRMPIVARRKSSAWDQSKR